MKRFKKSHIAKLVLISAMVLVVFLFVVIIVQNIQIKALEEQLENLSGTVNYFL